MDCKNVSDQIVNWLNYQLEASNQKGFVVGVSGGIDSALVSTLCALTGKPTLAISIPIHQAKSEHSRCDKHLDWLTERFSNVLVKQANLTTITDAYQEYIQSVDLKLEDDLVKANIRSRLRMTTLYSFANAYGFLVAGTGNKVEDFGVGFFSKYGDGGVDISPIGDLLKSEVRELSAYLEISEGIVKAAPTDGLWCDGRTDEDQIGATYDELEDTMNWLYQTTSYERTPRQMRVLSIYLKRHNSNAHKMQMPPICKVEK